MVPIDFRVLNTGKKGEEGETLSLYGNDADGRGKGSTIAKVSLDKLKPGQFSKSISEWKSPEKIVFKAKDILEVGFNGKKNSTNCLAIVTLIKLQ